MRCSEYRVVIAPTAFRDIEKIDEPDYSRVKRRILSLGGIPRPPGTIKLKDHLHRVRQGNWRILFAVEDAFRLVTILRVLRRSEKTYKGVN